jgi:hypothetical protein
VLENRVLTRILDSRERMRQEAGEDCILRSSIICTLHQILLGQSSHEDETNKECSTHGRNDKCVQKFGQKT